MARRAGGRRKQARSSIITTGSVRGSSLVESDYVDDEDENLGELPEVGRDERGNAPRRSDARASGYWAVDTRGIERAKSVRLVPKVNDPKANNDSEASKDPKVSNGDAAMKAAVAVALAEEKAERLLAIRLQKFGLKQRLVLGDGNCQFRAISDQMFGDEKHHVLVRGKVFEQLVLNPDTYMHYVPEDFEKYCDRMKDTTSWGDHVTLQAAADAFNIRIFLITSFETEEVIEVVPAAFTPSSDASSNDDASTSGSSSNGSVGSRQRKFRTDAFILSFTAEIHYNSVVSADVDFSPAVPVKVKNNRGSKERSRMAMSKLGGIFRRKKANYATKFSVPGSLYSDGEEEPNEVLAAATAAAAAEEATQGSISDDEFIEVVTAAAAASKREAIENPEEPCVGSEASSTSSSSDKSKKKKKKKKSSSPSSSKAGDSDDEERRRRRRSRRKSESKGGHRKSVSREDDSSSSTLGSGSTLDMSSSSGSSKSGTGESSRKKKGKDREGKSSRARTGDGEGEKKKKKKKKPSSNSSRNQRAVRAARAESVTSIGAACG